MFTKFGLEGQNDATSVDVVCEIVTNDLGLSVNDAMVWAASVDGNSDQWLNRKELEDHINYNWDFGRQVEADTRELLVYRRFLARKLATTVRQFAGQDEADETTPTSLELFRATVSSYIWPGISPRNLDIVVTTIEKDDDGITVNQLAAYFDKTMNFETLRTGTGEHYTGQGSKASKSRAEEVHAEFASIIFGRMVKRGILDAVGLQQDSMEEAIDAADFIQGLVNLDLSLDAAW